MTGELEVIQDTLADHWLDPLDGDLGCACGEGAADFKEYSSHVAAEVVLALRTWPQESDLWLCRRIDPTGGRRPMWLPVDDAEVTR